MWRSRVNGRTLRFRLVGINNQNFIMEDEETGTWWQQITGEALHGPLAGERLEPMPFEMVNLSIWNAEHPDGGVLAAEQDRLDDYAPSDWVTEMQADVPVPDGLAPAGDLAPRDLVIGVEVDGRAKAYPLDLVVAQTPVMDRVGDVPLLVAVAQDGRSVRVFDRRLDGAVLELYARTDTRTPLLIDAATGSEFDFRGVGATGVYQGRELDRVAAITEFWFDWHNYHPDTWVYEAGELPGS